MVTVEKVVIIRHCCNRLISIFLKAATIKQTSVGKFQILSSRCLFANVKYYQADVCLLANLKSYEADDVNLGFESELKFLSNG